MADEPVLVADERAVRTITLNRPEARNAISAALDTALTAAFRGVASSDAVAVVVLTGADPGFCAGLDLKELSETGIGGRKGAPGDTTRDNWYRSLLDIPQPVIGAVNGAAITGGFEMALNCDFLVASERARFADTHVRIGALPGGGMNSLLPRVVGPRMAAEMTYTGNFIDAAEAHRLGLVNHVVSHDDLLSFTAEIAHTIAGNDAGMVRRMKQEYRRSVSGTLAEATAAEQDAFRSWTVDAHDIAGRREAVMSRGRNQATGRPEADG